MRRSRSAVLRRSAVAAVVTVAALATILTGFGGHRSQVALDRDQVLADTCVSVLERSGAVDDVLSDRPELAEPETYRDDRSERQADGRRPSSVGVFRHRCRVTSQVEQFSVLVDLLSSRAS